MLDVLEVHSVIHKRKAHPRARMNGLLGYVQRQVQVFRSRPRKELRRSPLPSSVWGPVGWTSHSLCLSPSCQQIYVYSSNCPTLCMCQASNSSGRALKQVLMSYAITHHRTLKSPHARSPTRYRLRESSADDQCDTARRDKAS